MQPEDLQPNENQTVRRGNGVPVIRTSLRRGDRLTGRGRGRGRGWDSNSRPSYLYGDRIKQENPSSHVHPLPRRPNTPKYPSDFLDRDSMPSKRPRLEEHRDASLPSRGHSLATSASYHPARKKRKERPRCFTVEFPPHCQKGAYNCHNLRQSWIRREQSRLECEHTMKITHHHVSGNTVSFAFVEALKNEGTHDSETLSLQAPSSTLTGDTQEEQKVEGSFVSGKDDPGADLEDFKEFHQSVPDSMVEIACVSPQETFDIQSQGGANRDGYQFARYSESSVDKGSDSGGSYESPVLPASVDQVICERSPEICSTAFLPAKFMSGTLRIHSISPSSSTIPQLSAARSSPPSVFSSKSIHSSSSDSESDGPLLKTSPPLKRSGDTSRVLAPLHQPIITFRDPAAKLNVTMHRRYSADVAIASASCEDSRRFLRVEGDIMRLPKDPHDKPRRLLLPLHGGVMMVYGISKHGFIDEVDMSRNRKRRTLRTPDNPLLELVDDACLLNMPSGTLAVLGHAREDRQISLMEFNNGIITKTACVTRPSQCSNELETKHGVSALCSMKQPGKFATGGHDHLIHLWSLEDDSMSCSTPELLSIKHTSVSQSLLAIRDTSHKLVSAGADCNVHIWDLSSERVVRTMKLSNSVYHVHETSTPFCTLLEVGHRELQFEIRDHRLVPEKPVQRFGYSTVKTHGRFIQGDVHSSFFACGDHDGSVRLWDTRNTARQFEMVSCFPGHKVVQVAFVGSSLIACSEDNQYANLLMGS